MKGIKMLLASAFFTALCSQAVAAENTNSVSLTNTSNHQAWVKFTLLYPATDSCKISFPSNEQFNVVLGPKDTAKMGPYDSECHFSVTASPSNKFYYNCADGRDVTAGVSVSVNAENDDILTCSVK